MRWIALLFLTLVFSGCHSKLKKDTPPVSSPPAEQNKNKNNYKSHWEITSPQQISWDMKKDYNLPHSDNIEMAGKRVAGIISYNIDTDKRLSLSRHIIFPQLRTHIKQTDPGWFVYRAYLKDTYDDSILPRMLVGDKILVPGPVESIQLDGTLTIVHEAQNGLQITRKLMPSMSQRLFIENWVVTNTRNEPIQIKSGKTFIQQQDYGLKGKYTRTISSDAPPRITIPANKHLTFSITISAQLDDEAGLARKTKASIRERGNFLNEIKSALILETPEPVLNTLFEFSKIRASESIFESKLGLMHSPGGGRYYCGFWANDQAEYVGPFFPYVGYETAIEASLNTYRLFAKEMSPSYENIRYSFEMEGDAPINPLDRGDAAMIAYGAAQFAMANGDAAIAEELWPLIEWCLEYCRRKTNTEGVVESQSDEMEGRIETGTANLSTSSLAYGALQLAVDLGQSLNKPSQQLEAYKKQAGVLKRAIESYFGATVEGLDTYKYYKEHQYLRHWICLPLVVGIHDRKEATIEALFSKLWSENGVHVEKNSDNEAISKIFWDRGTLYALRGTFLAGATEESLSKLMQFSSERLLGKRVPYVVEAYPEGDMAHLSAESGLYCRVFTEGMFGIVPTGLSSFKCSPKLPQDWDRMALRNIQAFGQNFDLEVKRENRDQLVVRVIDQNKEVVTENKITQEEEVNVTFI
ncbi:six-hairpin glycosidase-like protein [Fulvivirga sp. M361]|uniref:six-hairpin glycosidase-like protein n=1 Tax=Fulvivirga sp. M361 TaxID=2594266 RepID=UPI0011978940|nr:six-hairpin glycosidase-like protein [Fulvivirga sp. M361]TRX61681.1 six-hairpin glycosidase-like protein [Fulvivirga sp. M361]